jgi:hypothetical protein
MSSVNNKISTTGGRGARAWIYTYLLPDGVVEGWAQHPLILAVARKVHLDARIPNVIRVSESSHGLVRDITVAVAIDDVA